MIHQEHITIVNTSAAKLCTQFHKTNTTRHKGIDNARYNNSEEFQYLTFINT
jgi:hypothetical protein